MKVRYAVLMAVFVLAIGAAGAGEADFHNCAICKPMASEPGLMQNMKWETHPIATGMLAVTTVTADYDEAYGRAHEKMMANVEKLEAGEEMPL